ncbi:hypothetical protein CEXT_662541 [Caerostris extrusa]|uniref:Uncharacterized protein n=1 Tax=Caerostris extrusa TaxID=172846 RepID=A0AAV4VCP6_CAEEX|nr:hypothetical protein CEXT_662541 [Caerostris extrusa]
MNRTSGSFPELIVSQHSKISQRSDDLNSASRQFARSDVGVGKQGGRGTNGQRLICPSPRRDPFRVLSPLLQRQWASELTDRSAMGEWDLYYDLHAPQNHLFGMLTRDLRVQTCRSAP